MSIVAHNTADISTHKVIYDRYLLITDAAPLVRTTCLKWSRTSSRVPHCTKSADSLSLIRAPSRYSSGRLLRPDVPLAGLTLALTMNIRILYFIRCSIVLPAPETSVHILTVVNFFMIKFNWSLLSCFPVTINEAEHGAKWIEKRRQTFSWATIAALVIPATTETPTIHRRTRAVSTPHRPYLHHRLATGLTLATSLMDFADTISKVAQPKSTDAFNLLAELGLDTISSRDQVHQNLNDRLLVPRERLPANWLKDYQV